MTDLVEESSNRDLVPLQTESNSELDFTDLSDAEKLQAVERLLECCKLVGPYNPLFELFTVHVEFEGETQGELHGYIEAHDELGSVVLFDRTPDNSHPICNKGLVPLHGPDPARSISAFGLLELDVELYVKTDKDEELQVANTLVNLDYNNHDVRYSYNFMRSVRLAGEQGSVTLYYLALKRAVQATLEASFKTPDDRPLDVYGSIVAYYGDFNFSCKPEDKELYRVRLFDRPKVKSDLLGTGEFPLARTVLPVPYKCSLRIEANLWEVQTGNEILKGTLKLKVKCRNSSTGCIQGQGYSIGFKVYWKCEDKERV